MHVWIYRSQDSYALGGPCFIEEDTQIHEWCLFFSIIERKYNMGILQFWYWGVFNHQESLAFLRPNGIFPSLCPWLDLVSSLRHQFLASLANQCF
jgi:hypothetical protein